MLSPSHLLYVSLTCYVLSHMLVSHVLLSHVLSNERELIREREREMQHEYITLRKSEGEGGERGREANE